MTWTEKDGCLERTFSFKNFSEAFAFMTQVALLCEQQNHHPTWENTYNSVRIRLTTHDAGHQITAKDHHLATSIDKLLSNA